MCVYCVCVCVLILADIEALGKDADDHTILDDRMKIGRKDSLVSSLDPRSSLFPLLALQGPYSTVRATFQGLSSLIRHASAGTLSSVSGVTNALSRNLGSHAVVRPIAGTMGLVSSEFRVVYTRNRN